MHNGYPAICPTCLETITLYDRRRRYCCIDCAREGARRAKQYYEHSAKGREATRRRHSTPEHKAYQREYDKKRRAKCQEMRHGK